MKELEEKLGAYLSAVDGEINTRNEKLIEANNRIEGLEGLVASLKREVHRLNVENAGLKEEVSQMRQQREEAIKGLREAVERATKAESERDTFRAHPKVMEEALARAKAKKLAIEAERERSQAEVDRLELELKEK